MARQFLANPDHPVYATDTDAMLSGQSQLTNSFGCVQNELSAQRPSGRSTTQYQFAVIPSRRIASIDFEHTQFISQLLTNPALLLFIGLLFFAVYLGLRNRIDSSLRPRALLWPGMAWTLWAVWELGIARFSPEANIRIDLLLIIPAVLLLTLMGLIQLFRTPT